MRRCWRRCAISPTYTSSKSACGMASRWRCGPISSELTAARAELAPSMGSTSTWDASTSTGQSLNGRARSGAIRLSCTRWIRPPMALRASHVMHFPSCMRCWMTGATRPRANGVAFSFSSRVSALAVCTLSRILRARPPSSPTAPHPASVPSLPPLPIPTTLRLLRCFSTPSRSSSPSPLPQLYFLTLTLSASNAHAPHTDTKQTCSLMTHACVQVPIQMHR
mmetsp:Transcript_83281/g.166261  ORF Transcript_83281/g.166261 Transcript_83281/m.166261 type:complete len:222 (-) Transcript_83281:677-1342(-)